MALPELLPKRQQHIHLASQALSWQWLSTRFSPLLISSASRQAASTGYNDKKVADEYGSASNVLLCASGRQLSTRSCHAGSTRGLRGSGATDDEFELHLSDFSVNHGC
jgi:hypothetical protein